MTYATSTRANCRRSVRAPCGRVTPWNKYSPGWSPARLSVCVGAAEQADLKRQGLHVIDASKQGWGIINHDLFLSNAQIRQVIRRAIDGQRMRDDRD